MNQPPPIDRSSPAAADTPPGPPADAPSDPRENVDALQGIVADIEQFVERWMPRFGQMLAQAAAAPQSHDSGESPEDLDQQRREWQQQRRLEAQRLKEKADQLTEAWLRLEQQQRAVLQAQAACQQRGGAPGRVPSASGESASSESSAQSASDRSEAGGTNSGGTDPDVGAAPVDRSRLSSRLSQQTPADQFERLRNAIGEPQG